jgi:hypothetical protein
MGGASKEDGLLYLMELYGNVCKLYIEQYYVSVIADYWYKHVM